MSETVQKPNGVRILVVDDEPTLCDTLKFNLELEGYDVDTAYSAEEALTLDLSTYSLILLDVMMGELSGFGMARILKSNRSLSDIPVIFLTARGEEDDMLEGLGIGADDYISKPYSIRNVVMRVRAVLRRTGTHHPATSVLTYGTLAIDPQSKECRVDGEPVRLPRKEFEILSLLMANPDKIYTRDEILHLIWPDEIVVLPRVVDVNITRLRSKLGRYGKNIITRSGYGYGFRS